MKLGQAVDYYSTTPLSGYNGTSWEAEVAKGSFWTFDRFITDRSFGQKKRIFQANSHGPIPDQYKVVKVPTGTRYMVAAKNQDIGGINISEHYADIYLLQECQFDIDIMQIQTSAAASGLPADATPTVVASVFGDMERLSSARSSEFESVYYTTSIVYMPEGTTLTTDHELRINGVMYDIVEHFGMMNLVAAKVNKRAA